MFSIHPCILTHSPQVVALFGKVVEILTDEPLLEDMGTSFIP